MNTTLKLERLDDAIKDQHQVLVYLQLIFNEATPTEAVKIRSLIKRVKDIADELNFLRNAID